MKNFSLNVHLASWLNQQAGGEVAPVMVQTHNSNLAAVVPVTYVTLSYPFDVPFELEINGEVTLKELISKIAETYKSLEQENPDNWWGHGFRDLFLEGLWQTPGGDWVAEMGS